MNGDEALKGGLPSAFQFVQRFNGSEYQGTSGSGIMKVRDALRILNEDGWFVVRTRGSHRVMKHASKAGIVVVPGHMSDDLAPGTLKSIRDQAQLESKL